MAYRLLPDPPESLSLAFCASLSVRPASWALSMALSAASGGPPSRRFSWASSMALSRVLCSFLWPSAGFFSLVDVCSSRVRCGLLFLRTSYRFHV